MTLQQKWAAVPPIHIVESEADMISDLAWAARDRFPDVSQLLLEEVGRAQLCSRAALPADVAAMGSTILYRDGARGTPRRVELVYPSHADVALGRISILTPVGAALIGMRAGNAILWPDRDGHLRDIMVDAVVQAQA
ncbi:nucleoside diphosphate kinase regulator [Sphingobium yanoikuyae]|jgi:regulator of nucleoside diphosphate kinase|uniref:Nucleoside diphosphate kinase regulator n=2 Tax=Sphingobium yanoikuyae TaxID=13690 RepID=A0A430C959_SPHYA|nr:nucleoside diphosphate kinase regulator [Sphingobium yanoikuyae]RSU61477.1 nucleoside diphosphate kinase regulator [Sphingobium yanoikuyae]